MWDPHPEWTLQSREKLFSFRDSKHWLFIPILVTLPTAMYALQVKTLNTPTCSSYKFEHGTTLTD
jgi:hypothetical protein